MGDGSAGRLTDPPPACPKCGKDIGADKDLETIRDALGPQPMTGEGFFKARVYAGLSLNQAAQMLAVDKAKLLEFEDGSVQPTFTVVRSMSGLYNAAFMGAQQKER